MTERAYIRDGAEIYRRSFAIIRAEADLARFTRPRSGSRCASSMPAAWSRSPATSSCRRASPSSARQALLAGAPIFCDSKMVANGITRARLPAGNEVVCTLDDPAVPDLAARIGNTRTRRGAGTVARPRWPARSSPSAMRRPPCSACSRCSTQGAPPPAAVIGLPVGFVGAAESKEALAARRRACRS